MTEFVKINLGIKHEFNPISNRHFLNDTQTVYHCHHYTTLYTQLALDAGETDLLSEVSENNFYPLLKNYYAENNVTNLEDKIRIACQYYSALGLGVIEVESLGDFSAIIVSKNSHIEEGWIKKWSKNDKPVNYVGCGYVSALLSAVLGKPTGVFATVETESIVMGNEKTVFKSFIK